MYLALTTLLFVRDEQVIVEGLAMLKSAKQGVYSSTKIILNCFHYLGTVNTLGLGLVLGNLLGFSTYLLVQPMTPR